MLGEKRALPGHQHWQLGAWLSIPVSSNWCSFYLFYLLGGSWHTSLLQSMPHFLLPCGHPFHISRASLREDISGNGQNSHLPTSFSVTLGYPLIFQLSRPTFLNSWGQNLAKRRETKQTKPYSLEDVTWLRQRKKWQIGDEKQSMGLTKSMNYSNSRLWIN